MSAPNSYQDFRNKTINWCQKLKQSGILNNDQLDSCIASVDLTSGNRQNILITKKDKNPTETNTYFITNNRGSYLSEDKFGNIVFIAGDIDTTSINQPSLIWTLIQNNATNISQYAILSTTGKYLITNDDTTVTSNGSTIGPATLWNISFIDSNIIAESVMFPNNYLSFEPNTSSLVLQPMKNEFAVWTLYPVITPDTSAIQNANLSNTNGNGNTQRLQNEKNQLITNLKEIQRQQIGHQTIIKTLQNLRDNVNNKYVQGKDYVASRTDLMAGLKPEQINDIVSKITKEQQRVLADIDSTIASYKEQLEKLTTTELVTAQQNFNNFLSSIGALNTDNSSKIANNTEIISRQNIEYDRYKQAQMQNNDSLNYTNETLEKMQINSKMMENYNSWDNIYYYLYIILIIVLVIGIIIAAYFAYKKFKKNILKQYD